MDYWTSFGRTLNPNPDPEFLRVRGYWNTLNQIAVSGSWDEVNIKQPMQMVLQWNSFMSSFGYEAQCVVVGQPLNYLE